MDKQNRKAIIAGNWKMNKTATEAAELILSLIHIFICAFGLASAAPRSPYRHLELCGIALSVTA